MLRVKGLHFDIEGAQLLFPPRQLPHPPLFFGGSSEEAIDIAARTVDKFLTWGEPPVQVAEKIGRVRASAAAESRTVKGAREIVLKLVRQDWLTVRQILDRILTRHRLFVGTPEHWPHDRRMVRAGAVDGFNLMPDVEPSGIEAFVEHVVPILRRRGLFRRHCEGMTLRDHLGFVRPSHRYPDIEEAVA